MVKKIEGQRVIMTFVDGDLVIASETDTLIVRASNLRSVLISVGHQLRQTNVAQAATAPLAPERAPLAPERNQV